MRTEPAFAVPFLAFWFGGWVLSLRLWRGAPA